MSLNNWAWIGASLIVYSILSWQLPWAGVEEGTDKPVESTKSHGNPSLLSLQTFITTFNDCPQDNVFCNHLKIIVN